MLLADTSVVIAQFRNFDPKREALIRGQPVGLCGPVLAEFLAGARTVPSACPAGVSWEEKGVRNRFEA